jgi:hypothetical protein
MNQIKDLPQAKYQLYFDNFFTSLRLIEALSAKNIGATGTIRADKKTKRGDYGFQSEEGKILILLR